MKSKMPLIFTKVGQDTWDNKQLVAQDAWASHMITDVNTHIKILSAAMFFPDRYHLVPEEFLFVHEAALVCKWSPDTYTYIDSFTAYLASQNNTLWSNINSRIKDSIEFKESKAQHY